MKNIFILLFLSLSTNALANCIALNPIRFFNGDEFKKTNGYIIIEGGIVISIDMPKIPTKCNLVDIHSSILIPGLIDSHSLIFANDITFGYDYSKGLLKNTMQSKKERVVTAKKRLKSYLGAGFTTVRDLGNSGRFLDVELKRSLNDKIYPLLYASGPGISAQGGQFEVGTKNSIVKREYDIVGTNSNIHALISKRIAHNTDQVKLYADNDPNPNRIYKQKLRLLVNLSNKNNLKSAIHATEKDAIEDAIYASPSSIEHAYQATAEQMSAMAAKNIFLVPTDIGTDLYQILLTRLSGTELTSFIKYAQYMNVLSEKRINLALKANTKIAFGSDFYLPLESLGVPFMKGVLSSLYSLNDYGLGIEQTLNAATKNAAKLLGNKKLGVIEKGSIANLVVVERDITKNIRSLDRPKMVFLNGSQVEGNK